MGGQGSDWMMFDRIFSTWVNDVRANCGFFMADLKKDR